MSDEERKSAWLASRDCGDCHGAGITVRWRKYSAGTVNEDGRPVERSIRLYCTCAYGQWLEIEHSLNAPQLRRELLNLADYPFLQGEEYRLPPMSPQEAAHALESFRKFLPAEKKRREALRLLGREDQKKRLTPSPEPMPGEHEAHELSGPRRIAGRDVTPRGSCPFDGEEARP